MSLNNHKFSSFWELNLQYVSSLFLMWEFCQFTWLICFVLPNRRWHCQGSDQWWVRRLHAASHTIRQNKFIAQIFSNYYRQSSTLLYFAFWKLRDQYPVKSRNFEISSFKIRGHFEKPHEYIIRQKTEKLFFQIQFKK